MASMNKTSGSGVDKQRPEIVFRISLQRNTKWSIHTQKLLSTKT